MSSRTFMQPVTQLRKAGHRQGLFGAGVGAFGFLTIRAGCFSALHTRLWNGQYYSEFGSVEAARPLGLAPLGTRSCIQAKSRKSDRISQLIWCTGRRIISRPESAPSAEDHTAVLTKATRFQQPGNGGLVGEQK
jgi:hypothetical protein